MSAAIFTLQIADRYTKERISEVVKLEAADLSNEYEVSIIDSRRDDTWELRIKRPDGSKITSQLHRDLGDLTPAVFRIRLRELLKLL